MTELRQITIALIGNPNSGKSSVFNQLTGMRQKTGNFPGVTVEKKSGYAKIDSQEFHLIDLPGTYSLYPNSQDERIVLNILSHHNDPDFPDAIVFIADITQLERHLLLVTQLRDLGIPLILALNMIDVAREEGIEYDTDLLSQKLEIPVIPISARLLEGFEALKNAIYLTVKKAPNPPAPFYLPSDQEKKLIISIKNHFLIQNDYQALLWLHHFDKLPYLSVSDKDYIRDLTAQEGYADLKNQINETMQRFDKLQPILYSAYKRPAKKKLTFTDRIDQVLTNNYLGPLIFIAIMILTFQAIFTWAVYPMDWIEKGFEGLSSLLKQSLPVGWLTDLLTDGVLAGLSGVLVFIPQIAILFFLISTLEEVGYMARAVYLFDKLMQQFGLNGRSIVSLISGGACAIPAIMSTRTISNWKERLITIMVTPLISCSARIPVYTLLVSFTIPSKTVWGLFGLQGLTFMGLYLLGIGAALISSLVFNKIIKGNESTFLMIELPDYRAPQWKNILITVYEKVRSFVTEAGKIIMLVSVVLWALASFGPPTDMKKATAAAKALAVEKKLDQSQFEDLMAAHKIEASYAGHLGKWIEPVIRPLGFDWKIGIALITSFAAREVFVGTMSTIYSIGSKDDTSSLKQKMARDLNPETGEKVFTLATSFSLLIFYVFAMQCMSTIAVVYRETKSWKWPFIQLLYMSFLAYLGSLIVYHIFI